MHEGFSHVQAQDVSGFEKNCDGDEDLVLRWRCADFFHFG